MALKEIRDILLENDEIQRLRKLDLVRTSSLIGGLPDDLVEKTIWPHLRDQSTHLENVDYQEGAIKVKDLIWMGCCSKRWHYLVKNSKFWAKLRFAALHIAKTNEILQDIPNGNILSDIHVARVFMEDNSKLPDISILGTLSLENLYTVRRHWRRFTDDERKSIIERFK